MKPVALLGAAAVLCLAELSSAQADRVTVLYGNDLGQPSVFDAQTASTALTYQTPLGAALTRLGGSHRFGQFDDLVDQQLWFSRGAWHWHVNFAASTTHRVAPLWRGALSLEHPTGVTGLTWTAGLSSAVYTGAAGRHAPEALQAGGNYYFGNDYVGASVHETWMQGHHVTVLIGHGYAQVTPRDSLNLYTAWGHDMEPLGPDLIEAVSVRSLMLVWQHKVTSRFAWQVGLGRALTAPGSRVTETQLGASWAF